MPKKDSASFETADKDSVCRLEILRNALEKVRKFR